MVDRHCPFLNREDPRCAAHFRVDQLQHAMAHCADQYAACPSYRELLAERIMRRAAESRVVEVTVGGKPHDIQRHKPAAVVLCIAAPRWSVTDAGLVAAA